HQVVTSGDSQIVRLQLTDRALASAGSRGASWVLTIGEMVIEPTAPVSLMRGFRSDGASQVSIAFANTGAVHQVSDPDAGDDLVLVPGLGPPRAITKPYEFVEFQLIEPAHGIAIRPLVDDLAVRLTTEELFISRRSGLTLSPVHLHDPASDRRSTTAADHPS